MCIRWIYAVELLHRTTEPGERRSYNSAAMWTMAKIPGGFLFVLCLEMDSLRSGVDDLLKVFSANDIAFDYDLRS